MNAYAGYGFGSESSQRSGDTTASANKSGESSHARKSFAQQDHNVSETPRHTAFSPWLDRRAHPSRKKPLIFLRFLPPLREPSPADITHRDERTALFAKIMIRYLLFIVIAQAACANEAASRLFGSWRSDAIATNAYLAKYARLTEHQAKVFSTFFGKAVITYNADGTGHIEMEGGRFPKVDGGEIVIPARKTEFTYKILGETDSQIVIQTTSGEVLAKEQPFSILKLEDKDTYSISLSESFAEINGREFFKRIKDIKAKP